MKKFILLAALVSVITCKKKEEQPAASKGQETVEVSTSVTGIDYAGYGMSDEGAPKGLEKGAKAPEVELVIDGESVALADLYKEQNVALIFYRGHWCPSCNKHLSEFATRAKELENKGIKLIAVTPETDDGVEKTKEKTKANFTIVTDADGSVQKAFDVDYKVTDAYQGKVQEKLKVSIAENNALGLAVLPVPATYVINTNGEIIFAHFDPNYNNRASVDAILEVLE